MSTTINLPVGMQFSCLDRYSKQFSHIEGWFWPDSIAIWDSLLSFQKSSGKTGNFFEIGVYRGKSAALSTLHAREDETCVLLDPHISPECKQTINSIKPKNVIYAEIRSTDLLRSSGLPPDTGNCRWIHIDGEHTGMAVLNDMTVANLLLNEDGVVVIDDFFNPQYPQITSAVFDWINQNARQMVMFLVGNNKCYLCRPRSAQSYLTYVKQSLYEDMAARNRPDVSVWKSTVPSDMNTFGLTDRFESFDYVGPDWDRKTISI
jgi:predicted O-methyltransferase YrrM